MKSPDKKNQENNKVKKFTTYPVPYALDIIKENISVNNTLSKLSKEQIINKAFELHLKGDILEAKKYYQNFIEQGFFDARVFSNYAIILLSIGKSKEAVKYILKVLDLQPDFAEAHANLGIILNDLGQSEEAEISARKSLELKPNFPEFHSNLGNILKDIGKFEEALTSTEKAIKLKSELIGAYFNMAKINLLKGDLVNSTNILKELLKLKSSNIGNKIEALVSISLNYLIQGDFVYMKIYLEEIKKYNAKKAIQLIKNKESRVFTSVFSSYLSKLYNNLNKNKYIHNVNRVPHIGESHCLAFSHQSICLSSQQKYIQPVFIAGTKAWHFSNRKINKFKSSFEKQILEHTYSNDILLSFGEIDCRKDEGILDYAIKNKKDIMRVCENTIIGYLDFTEKTLSSYFSKRYYFGTPAPTIKEGKMDELNILWKKLIKNYNSILKREVLSRGSFFIDIYSLTANSEGINNDIYMCDEIHLSPKCLSILFENYLFEPSIK